ncbi:MAG: carboxypeptidase-like regulatory domain-containing protein [Planctomycetota bacterium]
MPVEGTIKTRSNWIRAALLALALGAVAWLLGAQPTNDLSVGDAPRDHHRHPDQPLLEGTHVGSVPEVVPLQDAVFVQVQWSSGEAVVGARVLVTPGCGDWDEVESVATALQARSDDRGQARVALSGDGVYSVRAIAPDGRTSDAVCAVRPGMRTTVTIPQGRVLVIVTDNRGAPVASAEVLLETTEACGARATRSGITDQEGKVLLQALPLSRDAIAYLTVHHDDYCSRTRIRVPSGDEQLAVRLVPCEGIRVSVLSGGRAVPDAQLRWMGISRSPTGPSRAFDRVSLIREGAGITDADGELWIHGVSSHDVVAVHVRSASGSAVALLEPAQDTVIELGARGVLSCVVRTEDGEPVAGATVRLRPRSAQGGELARLLEVPSAEGVLQLAAVTGTDGRCSVGDLPLGNRSSWTISVLSSEQPQVALQLIEPEGGVIELGTEQDAASTVVVGGHRPWRVRGRVADALGEPIVGATVGTGDHDRQVLCVSGVSGEFEAILTKVAATLVARHPDFCTRMRRVDRPRDGTDLIADFALDRAAILGGTVAWLDGTPLAGAQVALQRPDGGYSTWTGSAGDFRFTGVQLGEYDLVVAAPQLHAEIRLPVRLPYHGEISVTASERAPQLARIVGSVSGAPAGSQLGLLLIGVGEREGLLLQASTSGSSFEIDHVPVGLYLVRVAMRQSEGYVESTHGPYRASVGDSEWVVPVSRTVEVVGSVEDPQGHPVDGLTVFIHRIDEPSLPVAVARSDGSGTIRFHATPGEYNIEAWSSDFGLRASSVRIDAGVSLKLHAWKAGSLMLSGPPGEHLPLTYRLEVRGATVRSVRQWGMRLEGGRVVTQLDGLVPGRTEIELESLAGDVVLRAFGVVEEGRTVSLQLVR